MTYLAAREFVSVVQLNRKKRPSLSLGFYAMQTSILKSSKLTISNDVIKLVTLVAFIFTTDVAPFDVISFHHPFIVFQE